MRWLVAIALALPSTAAAQSCGGGVGGASATTYAHRDWDLSTPGPRAGSSSPALALDCRGAGVWMGIRSAPGVRHSYGSLMSRGTLGTTAHFGLEINPGDGLVIGPVLSTNGFAWGTGLRIRHWDTPFDLRLEVWPGRDPTVVGTALFTLPRAWDPGDRDGIGLFGKRAELRLRHGFEIGTVTGYRLEVGPRWAGAAFGLRAGTLTRLRADAAGQPLALGFVDLPLAFDSLVAAEIGMGVTYRKGELQSTLGLRVVGDFDSPLQIHGGVLVGLDGERWTAADAGIGMVW